MNKAAPMGYCPQCREPDALPMWRRALGHVCSKCRASNLEAANSRREDKLVAGQENTGARSADDNSKENA